jgi:HEAT repeat protein
MDSMHKQNDSCLLSERIVCIGLALMMTWGCKPVQQSADPVDPFSSPARRPSDSSSQQLQRAGQILQESLISTQPRLRGAGAEVVGSTRQLRFLATVRQLMRDPVVPVRFAAILAVGDTGYTPAHHDLVQICNEPGEDLNVRMAAAYALGRMGARDYTQLYLTQISHPDQTVRANAALLIGKGGHREALNQLYWALQDSRSSDRVHMQVVDSLAQLGDERIMERLWTRLISSYVDDRIDGVRGMGKLGTQQALEAVQTMLDDPEMEVRLAAAEQLGRAGDRHGEDVVLDIIKETLKSSHPMDREQEIRILAMSAVAIAGIGTPSLTRYLDRYLTDDSPIVRLAGARAVFETQALKNRSHLNAIQ